MIVPENMGFGYPPEGNMNRSRAEDAASEVFGLDGVGDALYLPVNLFMLGVGGILAVFGTAIKNKTVDTIIRVVGGAGAGFALISLLRGRETPVPEPTKQGLGSEWSPEDDPTYDYVNRFYHAINTTRRLPWAARMPQSRLFTSRR